MLTAIQNREFNKDDVEEFKRDGAVGENARGLLDIRPLPRLQTDANYRKLVEDIVAEENRDRQIIMQRITEINSNAPASEVEKVFAKMNHDNARSGDWLQLPDGAWVKK